MGKKLKKISSYFLNHKYLWTFAIFALIIGVLDTNSLWNRWEKRKENKALRAEIKKYERQCSKDSAKLRQLMSSPEAVIRVARETHLMKSKGEDVYIVTVMPQDKAEE